MARTWLAAKPLTEGLPAFEEGQKVSFGKSSTTNLHAA
jgi:hypothetical protein